MSNLNIVKTYVNLIQNGAKKLADVPEVIRPEVEKVLKERTE